MNFEQAVQEMIKGHRVRLSDWVGFWHMPYVKTVDERAAYSHYSEIRVFTRDGDTLDTPNIDRYKDRDDWEVVTQIGWGFDMALRFLKNNKTVRRSSWTESYVVFQEYGGLYIDINNSGTAELYDPKRDDIFANDWQIVTA
jgi:hypothetical protein